MKIVLAGTRAQNRTGKAQSACPSVLQHRRNTQLAKVRIRQIHTWQAGHQGALMHFFFFLFIILGKQCIEAPRCKIFDFLPGQHPRPFNNFKEIGCAPAELNNLFRIWTRANYSICSSTSDTSTLSSSLCSAS